MEQSTDSNELLAGMAPWGRIYLARTLAETRSEGARQVLEVLLADEEPRVREEAARALERVPDPASIPALREALRDPLGEVRLRAAEALAVLGTEGAAHLIHAVRESNGEINFHAVCELGKLRCADAVPLLCEILAGGTSLQRAQVAEALGQIGSAEAVEPLTRLLKTTRGWERSLVAEAIRKCGHGGEGTRLAELLERSGTATRQQALTVLRATGDLRAAWTLIELFRVEESNRAARPTLRCQAAETLRELGAISVEPLCIMLRDGDTGIRDMAAWTLQGLGADAVPAVIETLQDPEPAVRAQAAAILGAIGAAEAGPLLCQALGDRSASVRRQAALALGKLPEVDAVSALCGAVRDLNHEVGEAAIEALGAVGDARAAPTLIRVLQWEPQSAREAALALAQIARRGGAAEALLPAIPLLRRRLSRWSFQAAATRQDFHAALEALEAATDKVTDLPVPASGALLQDHQLPRPATPSMPAGAPLPRPAAAPNTQPEAGPRTWWSRR